MLGGHSVATVSSFSVSSSPTGPVSLLPIGPHRHLQNNHSGLIISYNCLADGSGFLLTSSTYKSSHFQQSVYCRVPRDLLVMLWHLIPPAAAGISQTLPSFPCIFA